MTALLSFQGRIGPLRYALWSVAAFFSQHLAVLLAVKTQHVPLIIDWTFYVAPLRALMACDLTSNVYSCPSLMPAPLMLLTGLYLLFVCWVLAVLAFRRAADANVNVWVAAFATAPILQLPVIACLSFFPSQPGADDTPAGGGAADWKAVVHGVVAGVAVTLFGVAVGTFLFGSYGYGVFIVSPFLVGAIAAYFANRARDIGAGRTATLVVAATVIGGMALVASALEGVICIVLASPLGFAIAIVGGFFGRAIAKFARRPARQALSGFAILPMVFAFESVLPPATSFESYQTIEVAAPPEAVWRAVLKMATMDEPPLPFRLGVAYPIRGEVIGEGVGAVRRGEFSTGTAIERVTEWEPNRKLAFVVEKDVPAMRELSPYEHVLAPHAVGYFRTSLTSFELVPKVDGGTLIVERTAHELRLDPAFYWLPMAQRIVHLNNARVLAHVRAQAERSMR